MKSNLRRRNVAQYKEDFNVSCDSCSSSNSSDEQQLHMRQPNERNQLEHFLTTIDNFHSQEINNDKSSKPMPSALATTTTTKRSDALTKRSLSESSVDEIHRSKQTANSRGCNRKMWRNELYLNAESRKAQPQLRNYNNAADGAITAVAHNASQDVHNRNHVLSNLIDVGIRVISVMIFAKLEVTESFKRKIFVEELWLYKNPRMPDIVSPTTLILAVLLVPFCTTLIHYLLTQDRRDFRASNLAWTMAVCLNGLTTSTLKITIGRPRPDFYYRCFPDGILMLNNATDITNRGDFDLFNCTGNPHDINEGRKSFPSGHSSFAFVSFGFVALYLGAKLHAFNAHGRAHAWRVYLSMMPLFVAMLVAISRYCDYHHHWQDVVVGACIGLFFAYFVYRQFYPSLFAPNCQRAYARHNRHNLSSNIKSYTSIPTHDNGNTTKRPHARHAAAAAAEFDNSDNAVANDNIADYNDKFIAGAITANEYEPLINCDNKLNKWT